MTRESAKEYFKDHLEDYLEKITKKKGSHYICPFCKSGTKEKGTAAGSISPDKRRYTCFSCTDGRGDTLDLIGLYEGLTEYKDQFKRACELFNITIDNDSDVAPPALNQDKPNQAPKPQKDYTDYIMKCKSNVHKTDYFAKRGFDKKDIDRCNLGYDENYTTTKDGKTTSYGAAVIIPYDTSNKYYIARLLDKPSWFPSNYIKPPADEAGSEPLYNTAALYGNQDNPVFVVESPFCAISIMRAGEMVIAIGGTGSTKLINQLKEKPTNSPLILSLDNDKAGQEAAAKLEAELQPINIKSFRINISGEYKDPNEALVADEGLLLRSMSKALEQVERDMKEISKINQQSQEIKNPLQHANAAEDNNTIIPNDIIKITQEHELDNGFGEISTKLKNGSLTNVDLDLIDIQYNPNYIIVTYVDNKIKRTCRKSLYIKKGEPGEYKHEFAQVVDENLTLLLKHYGLHLKYNIMKNRIEVYEDGIYSDSIERLIPRILDKCVVQQYDATQQRLEGQLSYNARKDTYNPIKDYLEECYKQYDGKDYIPELCKTIDSPMSEEKKKMYIERFLLQMVWVSCSDERDTKHHSEFCLVLQGKQGQGKTSWLKHLLPEYFRSEYFLDSRSMDLSKKDDVIEQATVWLCEMGEIAATFRKTDQESLKAYVTAAIDKVRLPYAKEAINKKRRMCLCATTNDREFLRDKTGDRRFAIIPCNKVEQFHNIDLSKLWAQIYHEYKNNNDRYYFTEEEIDVLFEDNKLYRVKSDLELALLETFELYPENGDWYKASATINKMNFAGLDTRNYNLKNITQTLKELGCKWRMYNNATEFYIKLLK